jgi:hypothetical protein
MKKHKKLIKISEIREKTAASLNTYTSPLYPKRLPAVLAVSTRKDVERTD